jgi:mono/diheme cytochrome c family protein
VLAAAIGLRVTLFADPNHPTTPDPAPPAAAKVEPAKTAPPTMFDRVNALRAKAVPGEPLDEPLGGKTMKGTPITPRIPECFPAESRDLFWQMDMVSAGKDAPLQPLNFDTDGDGKISDQERNAIRGRNTWLLWGGGNEGFWNWLAQDGYGITDFLVMLDSRTRGNRFVRAGLINQPGYKTNADPTKRILGLYLDEPVPEGQKNSDLPEGYYSTGHILKSPPWDPDAKRAVQPAEHAKYQRLTATDPNDYAARVLAEQSELFEPGDQKLFNETVTKLAARGDGVDYTVYGFPTGIFGLRLFLNPDFFGKGDAPAAARAYWKKQVQDTNDRYYDTPAIQQDPKLVRPFRVSVSCGFCHVGPHPLYPPRDPEAPDWANLSSNIGDQYWKPQPAFGNLQTGNSFLFHFLASQQPGTVDTSLVSTDHINNANTINAVFNINARLARAGLNPVERQSVDNVRVKSIEDPTVAIKGDNQDWRHTPRVLLDGSDSIGAFGALARVYLNIGTFYEEWSTCHNPLIGFKTQRPFRLETCQRNSVYWQTNERFRTDYLAAYFTLKYNVQSPKALAAANPPSTAPHTSTQPMKLVTAKEPDGKTQSTAAAKALALNKPEQRKHGREVWLDHCAICHSSKQPDGFALTFARKGGGESWAAQPAPKDATYVLPMDTGDWLAFKRSAAYTDYKKRLMKMVKQAGSLDGDPLEDNHDFWNDNYLSTDIRVPITLVGTNSGRSMATNGIGGSVWDNFSSLTYKELPAVGTIGYFNPISATNASYEAPAGGRGYYRPASHVSLWATAPFLHNNTMGVYLDDPSVKGRMVQFLDAIRRMLWSAKRASRSLVLSTEELQWLNDVQAADTNKIAPDMVVTRPGDLRGGVSESAASDTGFIYRLPQDASVRFAAPFARPLIEGVAGVGLTSILSSWLWIILVILLLWLAIKHRPRYVGITLIGLAVLVAGLLALSGLGGGGSVVGVLVMGATSLLEYSSLQWWVLAAVLAVFGVAFLQAKPDCDKTARNLLLLALIGITYAVLRMTNGIWPITVTAIIALWIGLKWKPTLPGFSRAFFLLLALLTATAGWAANCFINGRALLTVPLANIKIGPFPVDVGPIPAGTPVNLMMNMDPTSPKLPKAIVSMILATAEIKKHKLVGEAAWKVFSAQAGQALMDASKCPDFVLDRGHLFGETLDPDPKKNDEEKEALIAFLKTL